jgi:hypothetical protein
MSLRCFLSVDSVSFAESRAIERSAAHNLCIILRDAGNLDAAHRVMREHLSL